MACGILVPQPGIEPGPPALGATGVSATGPPGKSRLLTFLTEVLTNRTEGILTVKLNSSIIQTKSLA